MIQPDIDQVPFPLSHRHFLLLERNEQIFHDTPFQKCAGIIHVFYFHELELPDRCQRTCGSSDQPPFIIMINKHLDLIPGFHVFRYVTSRQQDLHPVTAIQINPEVKVFHYFQRVVFSYLNHMFLFCHKLTQ